MTPVTLSKAELEAVLKLVNGNRAEHQAGRICRLLAQNPATKTVDINQSCSVGNLSDVVNNAINSRIHSLGLYVACFKPLEPIINQFGQLTGQHRWSFYRYVPAANDKHYDSYTGKDDDELRGKFRENLQSLSNTGLVRNQDEDLDEAYDEWLDTLTEAEAREQCN